MSPRQKILFVAGLAFSVNVLLVALLFILPAPKTPERTNNEPLSGTTTAPTTTAHVLEQGTASFKPAQPKRQTLPPDEPPHAVRVAPIHLPVAATSTVLDAMQAYKKVSDTFTFSGKEYPGLGLFVEEMNGVENGNGFHWMLYVNDTTADTGASTQRVVPGDTVEWRYEE